MENNNVITESVKQTEKKSIVKEVILGVCAFMCVINLGLSGFLTYKVVKINELQELHTGLLSKQADINNSQHEINESTSDLFKSIINIIK